jgi:DNA-directed RNA polymerase beta' subunit
MDNDHPNIITRDWRIQAITTLATDFTSPWTKFVHKAGTPVVSIGFIKRTKNLLQMPVPNPCAMYISVANRAVKRASSLLSEIEGKYAPIAHRKLAVTEVLETRFFDAIEEMVTCIIFSYSAIEAFANSSVPDDYKFRHAREDKRCDEIYNKLQIERNLPLEMKLDELLPPIYSVPSPKGTKVWNDFFWLKDMRDRFTHLKSSDWDKSSPEKAPNYIWTKLFESKVLRAPNISLSIINYYFKKQKPRWLIKALK